MKTRTNFKLTKIQWEMDIMDINRVNLKELAQRESYYKKRRIISKSFSDIYNSLPNFYSTNDFKVLLGLETHRPVCALRTLDELLEKDKQREKDGFPRKIKLGRLTRPSKDKKRVVIVPVVTEEKFLHDNSITSEEKEQGTGGTGEEEEGDIIVEIPIDFDGEGNNGAGDEGGGDHDIDSEAYELGKILTEKFELPYLKDKGKKRSFTKFKYDLTDRHRRTGQVLDKKETLKKIVETNLVLGNVSPDEIDPAKLLVNPSDMIYKILSREKDYESEAVVFFLRDYSGSMMGKPTDIVVKQHLFIYAWLMYQYQNNVTPRFILHDTDAKEVPDFDVYYNSVVAGGTMISSAFSLVNKIVEEENLARDYNIYAFYGSDGEDWETGEETVKEIRKMFSYINRVGATVVQSPWSSGNKTAFEEYIKRSGLLKEKPKLIRLDSINEDASEDRIIEGIKKLISQNGTN